ncbi:MAG: hypothetical protein GF418_09570, partial [Chitinivibrionales bacterium]|nr:hypothetical protein [Chitinivibrionales bacterium]MBD3395858.1 hypothetical protein [Chitinivibrionales bacterium]
MGRLITRFFAALPVLFVATLIVPSLIVMTGCDDSPTEVDTVTLTDTLIDTVQSIEYDTLIDSLTGDTIIDTQVTVDTFTVNDTLFEDGMKIIRDADIDSGESLTLSSDTVYLLDGFVFVENTGHIEIEKGTVIKAKPGGGLNASALIICRGATIKAKGSKDDPIIFTAQQDNLDEVNDLTQASRGLWGGLILLGKSRTNRQDGIEQIEGIQADDPRGEYGGGSSPDLDDSSGVLKYVSIRYG